MNNGKKAIILSMEMREGNNIVQYGKEVDKVLAAFQEELPESVSIQRIADQPKVVDDSVSSFVRDLFVSIVVVILAMMLLFLSNRLLLRLLPFRLVFLYLSGLCMLSASR